MVSKSNVKCVRIRSFSGRYFPSFGLNTDQKKSEYGNLLRIELYVSFTLFEMYSLMACLWGKFDVVQPTSKDD